MYRTSIKKAFTLAEVLMCILIVGILSVIMITSIKPYERAMFYTYSNIYHSISDSFYNVMITRQTGDPFELNDGGQSDGPKMLCKRLTEYINTFSDPSETCSDAKKINAKADSFDSANIQFTANNGMEFYLSEMLELKYPLSSGEGAQEEIIKYFLVFVDSNGDDKKPNSVTYSGKKDENGNYSIMPDIFAFALLETGKTVPLGVPEIDNRFLRTRVAYYNRNSEILYAQQSLPYYQAKTAAWGCYNSDWDPNAEGAFSFLNPDEPFTMNDVIRDQLVESFDSAIYDADKFSVLKDRTSDQELFEVQSSDNSNYQCNRYDIDNCYVVVDKFMF